MKASIRQSQSRNYALLWLLFCGFVLSLIGVIFVYSASSVFAAERYGSAHYFLRKHVFFLIVSFVAFAGIASIPFSVIKRAAPLLFFATLGAMLLTFIPFFGQVIHGSSRWLSIAGVSVQPSEFLKLTLLLYLATLFERQRMRLSSIFSYYAPFACALSMSFVLLLVQPDFGSVVTLFVTSLTMFFISGIALRSLLIAFSIALPTGLILIFFKAYRFARILVFLNPWADPKGRGYQIIQSLIAIGSGGMWGLGITGSRQKFFYLPMQHTDFIFSIIAEESGFVGGCIIITLFILLCFFGMRLARMMTDIGALYTTFGLVTLITLEALTNLMVVSGLVPTKGLGLPFVSYGGSALLAHWCMLGVIASATRFEMSRS